jgi:hypothetical protein
VNTTARRQSIHYHLFPIEFIHARARTSEFPRCRPRVQRTSQHGSQLNFFKFYKQMQTTESIHLRESKRLDRQFLFRSKLLLPSPSKKKKKKKKKKREKMSSGMDELNTIFFHFMLFFTLFICNPPSSTSHRRCRHQPRRATQETNVRDFLPHHVDRFVQPA